MRQAIQQSCRHPLSLKNLRPVAERQITCDQKASPFVAIGKDLEEQLGTSPAERQITQLVADQQLELVQLSEEAVELVLFLCVFQALHQCRCREEADATSLPASRQAQGGGQMRLACARVADEAAVETLIQPLASGQLQDLRLTKRRHRRE